MRHFSLQEDEPVVFLAMNNPAAKLLLLLVFAASSFSASSALQQLRPASCIPHEQDALLAFKRGISSDPTHLLASWQKDEDCCRWKGVRCSNRTGHVVKLQLPNVHTSFEDPAWSTGLVGQISHSLLSLNHLVHLDLSMNYLNGSSGGHIPEFLSYMANLRYLNLSGIPFSGRVPPHLGNLTKLQYLDLSGPSQGQLYSTDISWLAGLSGLRYLSMNTINLSTIFYWPDVVNMIPSLKALSLSFCSLLSANQTLPLINLTNLEIVDLSGNNFDHPMASSWVWNLTGLQNLKLAATNLYGKVPDTLGDMTSLQVLDLAFSRSQNTRIMTTSLKKLCNLTVLDLRYSKLYGDMKEFIERMPQCPSNKLQVLHLAYNNISGTMPSQMAHLTSLVIFDISLNSLSGPVPSEIGMFSNLTSLDLSHNKLTGDITDKHFEGLAKLKRLHLYGNSLKFEISCEWLPPFSLEEVGLADCKIGPLFPAWLRFQVNLHQVDISNTGIIDKLPDWFSTTFSKATYLDISRNKINGRLPKDMEFLSLEWFFLSSNELTGQIPSLPKNLSLLDLSLNSLSGNLTSKFGTPELIYLDLFSNQITGNLSDSICELQSLVTLDLGDNLFEGELPQCFPADTLEFLLLGNNSFSGNFPLFLQNFNQLLFLDLSRNKFSGKLPSWIGDLIALRFLRLNQNVFSGNIPTSITNLTHLHHLNLANNTLSGVIPWGLSNMTAMTRKYVTDPYLDEAYGGYSQMVPESGQYDIRVLELVSIDLSFNHLSGGIPDDIASLDALLNLDLSWNHLSGEVPDKIGAMKSLESLDLSNNVLSAQIPSSLSDLSYLSYLDLSDNNLTGTIPSGRQLDTLYAEYPSMYSGNRGLCGPPLPNLCSRNNASRQDVQNRNEHGFEPMSFYFGLGLGFMTGLWAVFCIVLFKKAWSDAYFRLIDNIYDQMSVLVAVTTWNRLGR